MPRIYLGLMLLSALVAGGFALGAWVSLQSYDSIEAANASFRLYSLWLWYAIRVSAIVLLVFGNLTAWRVRASWPLWATFVYCSLLVVLRDNWLEAYSVRFRIEQEGMLYDPPIPLLLIVPAFFIVPGLLVTLLNHFLLRFVLDWRK